VKERERGEGRKEKYVHRDTEGKDAKFVDRIEFCIKDNQQQPMCSWVIIGDSSEARCGANVITDATPLYTAVTNGGFFSRSALTVTTQGPLDGDGALALLIAQITSSEYSIAAIKEDTNSHYPRSESELASRFTE